MKLLRENIVSSIKIKRDELKLYFVTHFWDYPQRGICRYNGKIALFEAKDETDYETMTNTCPCCKPNGTDNSEDCHCENASMLYYVITELPWYKRMYYRLYPYIELCWYIKRWGWEKGIYYWKRWKHET